MNPPPPCDPSIIAVALAGKLEASDADRFEHHLETCEPCRNRLMNASADESFWGEASEYLSSIETQSLGIENISLESELQQILDPTDDPRMMGRLAGCEISGVVGRGGMGIVPKGRDVSLDQFVAIKVMHPAQAISSVGRSRFAREARAAASVVHDNVVQQDATASWMGLIRVYIRQEKPTPAIEWCERYLKIKPDNADVQALLKQAQELPQAQ